MTTNELVAPTPERMKKEIMEPLNNGAYRVSMPLLCNFLEDAGLMSHDHCCDCERYAPRKEAADFLAARNVQWDQEQGRRLNVKFSGEVDMAEEKKLIDGLMSKREVQIIEMCSSACVINSNYNTMVRAYTPLRLDIKHACESLHQALQDVVGWR